MRLLLVGCLLTTGCGAEAGLGTAGSDDAHPEPDGGTGSSGLAVPSPLLLSSAQFTGGTTGVLTSLVFRNPGVTPEGLYAPTRVDGCYISDCASVPYVDGVGIDVGTLSVSDGVTTIMQTPRANGYYVPAGRTGDLPLWSPGATLTFGGTGGDLPAFAATVTMGARLALTAPPTTIDHAQPFALTWSGGEGTVIAVIAQNLGTAVEFDDLRIVCELDGAAGAGTISAAVMAHLKPGLKTIVTVGNAGIANSLAGSAPVYAYSLNGEQVSIATTQ